MKAYSSRGHDRAAAKRPCLFAAVLPRLILFGLIVSGCGDEGTGSARSTDSELEARLTLRLALGEGSELSDAETFGVIKSVLVTQNGDVWIVDGSGDPTHSRIRVFDSTGTMISEVGRWGNGPGEIHGDGSLAELPDGRIGFREYQDASRILAFSANGADVDEWPRNPGPDFSPNMRMVLGSAHIGVDTAGRIWLPFRNGRIGDSKRVTGILRVDEKGAVIDRLVEPAESPGRDVIRHVYAKSRDGRTVRAFEIPFVSREDLWWRSTGEYVRVRRTDEYRIELGIPAISMETGSEDLSFSLRRHTIVREVPSARVSREEQDAIRRRLDSSLARFGADYVVDQVPEIPGTKPIIRNIRFADDGRLMVALHVPSVLNRGVWEESNVYDVFSLDGQYTGRLVFEPSARLLQLHGDRAWVRHSDEAGRQSVRAYDVHWTDESVRRR